MAGTIPDAWRDKVNEQGLVSMESGLDGRNNAIHRWHYHAHFSAVSMESGLDGRNNGAGVHARREHRYWVSMESGLDGRNNGSRNVRLLRRRCRLNGVRPRWPEQSPSRRHTPRKSLGLNGVRPRWPEQ